ncbi:PAS domain-containing protein [Methylobacter sp. S3L5C]|uniref:PAS domain-containing protein n=1 Tax=Methylobacter sp. S3L5C TaxID=2839024 RepID=UPI001FAE1D40|nr:PAS domain-containing protein [Methylobacter sp. S3L5C]UOA08263.1 PAS domain-containing protein [Methylobacter sp. S3L5C]
MADSKNKEKLFHTLELHQIELEIQNEELRRTQIALSESHYRYVDLYEFSPNGYLTLTREGRIAKINLSGTRIFGIEREALINHLFTALVTVKDRDHWHILFMKLMRNEEVFSAELSFQVGDGSECHSRLSCRLIPANDQNLLVRINFTDITENKLLEESLDRLQKIASQVPGVVYQFRVRPDGSCCFPYASEGLNNVHQLSPEEVREDASKLFSRFHPEDSDGIIEVMRKSLQDLSLFSHEYRVIDNDGTERWLFSNSVPQREADGSTLWHGYTSDITERKRIEKALQESEFLLKFAIEGANFGVWDCNLQTRQATYSPIWLAMLGYSQEDILPAHQEWLDRIHPDDQITVANIMQEYLEGQTEIYHVEYRLRCKDSSYKWILGRGMLVSRCKDGKPLRMIGTHTDITERKQIQEASREKEQILSQSQRIGGIGSWSLNVTTGYLTWSDEMYRIFGVSPKTFGHTVTAINALMLPDDLELKNSWFNDCLKGITMQELIFRIRLPDDSIRFICSSGKLQYDTMNKPLRLVGSMQDITSRKYQEQKSRRHLKRLSHVARLSLIEEIVSGIAREVDQPLDAIVAYSGVSLNLLEAASPDLAKLTEVIQKTQKEALRVGQIIHKIMKCANPNVHHKVISNLNELIQKSVDLYLFDLKRGNITILFELEDDLPVVNVDIAQIELVIINLIENSVEALENSPANQQRKISIYSRLLFNNRLEVRVKDNGSGIAEDQKQKILMPFYTTKTEGMGMGLSISRSIIEAHDGNLYFNSRHEKGSSFYFTLPTHIVDPKIRTVD